MSAADQLPAAATDRQAVPRRIVLGSASGVRVTLLDYGASIQAIAVPGPAGDVGVVLGYADVAAYPRDRYFMGSTIGRYAGRIRRGRFELGGRSVAVGSPEDTHGHTLHGGAKGLHCRYWQVDATARSDEVRFRYESPDGEQGFPGKLSVDVAYRLSGSGELDIGFAAVSDRDTVINLANHAYFNLNGDGRSVDDHTIALHADEFTVQDDELIPTGEIRAVEHTAYDLRQPDTLAKHLERLHQREPQMTGFDQNFVLRAAEDSLTPAASVESPRSGLRLELRTTQPGLQFYTGDGLGEPFAPRAGLCLEAQNFPDAPNQPGFPSALLRAGQEYRQRTVYAFGQL